MAANYNDLITKGFSPDDIEGLPVPELIESLNTWVATNR
jgi:hypothetical protein